MQTYVIKVGTQTLTTADGLLDHAVLDTLVTQIALLKQQGHFVVLVSSGAVGTGRSLLKHRPHLKNTTLVNEKQILAAMGQAALMQAYQAVLDRHNLQSAQILLTKQDFITKHHYQNIAHLFQSLRQQDFILPIVNENDSVAIQELMFTDNDELAGLLAAQLSADRLLLLTNVAGVYDRPPGEDGARIIPLINPAYKHSADAQGAPFPTVSAEKSALGRGGMQSKVNTARKMSRLGITTHIASGHERDIIVRLAANEPVGTTVLPLKKASSVKRWLAVAPGAAVEPPCVIANTCLCAQLKDPDRVLSVLPVGLIGLKGDFVKGERVHVLSADGELLAIGLARYDATQLQACLGHHKQPVFLHADTLFRTAAT